MVKLITLVYTIPGHLLKAQNASYSYSTNAVTSWRAPKLFLRAGAAGL